MTQQGDENKENMEGGGNVNDRSADQLKEQE